MRFGYVSNDFGIGCFKRWILLQGRGFAPLDELAYGWQKWAVVRPSLNEPCLDLVIGCNAVLNQSLQPFRLRLVQVILIPYR